MKNVILQSRDNTNSRLFGLIIIFMAVSLHQSGIMFGVNLSVADLFCFLGILVLISSKRLMLSKLPFLYFIALTIHTLFVSFIYVPATFTLFPRSSSVMINYIKLLVCFFYFILGNSIALLKQDEVVIKYYSYVALFIGFLGVIATLLSLQPLSSILVYEGVRLTGLMNDPNYFSLIQASALAYFCKVKGINGFFRIGICIILILSILASGSKTGLITIMVYMLIRLVETLLKNRIRASSFIRTLLLFIIIIVVAVNLSALLGEILYALSNKLPAFNRIVMIFTDFNSAVSGMGSGRDVTWKVALQLIKLSPIMGIGLGTYSALAEAFFGTDVIAHNTYLQLYSEWGIIFATLLFIYIFHTIGKTILLRRSEGSISILADMLIVFLIGSLAISLNNARMFWIFLGMLSATQIHTQDEENIND